jgi:hypothetical protein
MFSMLDANLSEWQNQDEKRVLNRFPLRRMLAVPVELVGQVRPDDAGQKTRQPQ